MAGNILTPNLIWNNFVVETDFNQRVLFKEVESGITFTHLVIDGRKVGNEKVKIYCVLADKKSNENSPAVLMLNDFNAPIDKSLIKNLVNSGFSVLSVDVEGEREKEKNYTVYPTAIGYANYAKVKDSLLAVDSSVQETCWYEWTCVTRYALSFLKSLPNVKKVGGIGVGKAGTAIWHVAGTCLDLDCAVFVLNSGWNGYYGIEKFSEMAEPQFSDDMYKYIAGVDPQSYAMKISCPTLMLSATNGKAFDVDRAFDTISRIDKDVYKAINYSVGYRNGVGGDAYSTALAFLNNFLNCQDGNCKLPSEVSVKCDIKDGKLVFTVNAEKENLKEVSVYCAEEISNSSKRCWVKISEFESEQEGEYEFTYVPYAGSEIVTYFAQCKYQGGYTIGSNILAKKFSEDEIEFSFKSNILYSSRIANAESVFAVAKGEKDSKREKKIFVEDCVKIKKGAMGIFGVCAENGLLTFKINAKKDKPNDNAILMFDVYSKERDLLTVRLIADYHGEKKEYIGWVDLLGGEVWQNVKFSISRFKTEEGMTLKSYDKIEAIEFLSEKGGVPLINNALWV